MMSLKRSAESSSGAATANKMARNRLGSRSRTPADATNVNMNVYVRIRPLNTREQGCRVIASVLNDKTMVFDPKEDSEPFFFKGSAQKGRDINRKVNKNMLFEFNRVFDENSTNEEVFCATTKNIVKSVLEGYNCSVFAYGATGAGKTFTMLGSPDNPGITYRTIVELLKQIDMMEGWKITIGASYIEVYNENVRDLLHPDTGMLQLREEEGGRVLVAGLRVETIRSSDQLFSLLAEGNRNRSQHPTDSNAESSRSHAVFQVHVRMEFQTDVKLAKLSMIDLAGSERGAATGCKGLRFKEGSNINKSLLSLGNCINALADGLKHVPYRDSKLTRILKDSLGGNCQTMMIANVSPASLAFEDTYNTLKYATRAKSIKSKVSKNVLSESLLSVAQYRKVVDELKQQLSKLENVVANNVNITNLHEWEQKIAAVMEEQKKIHKEMLTLQSEERLTQLRLKHKNNTLTMQDSTDESSNRTQIGIDQLTGRLESFRSRLEEYKPLLASNMEKVEALEKEIQQHPQLAPFLKHILDKYRYEIENENKAICLKHQWKITQLQAKQEERHTAAISYFPSVLKEFHCLLRAHGHLTNELDARYQTALKTFEGLKGVSFIDDENRELTEQEKLLRLSMGPVRDKPIVSEEEMNNHKKTVTFPLKEQCQNKMNSTFNTNGFKSTSLAKLPLKPTPSKPLFRNFSFSNKENSVSPAPPRLAPPGGTPGVTGRGAGFKAVRPSSNTLRTNPYMRSGIRSGIISKPRLNKLAAARMTAAVR